MLRVNPYRLILLLALGGTIILIIACSAPTPNDKARENSPEKAADLSINTTLKDTAWQLVQIMSMDDREFVPDEQSKYTLIFESEGHLIVRADCNRGQSTWSYKEPSLLEFGPLAMTRAMCPQGSLHDQFISDLGYVRSFVFEDGHLFLATMADGAILEFKPITP